MAGTAGAIQRGRLRTRVPTCSRLHRRCEPIDTPPPLGQRMLVDLRRSHRPRAGQAYATPRPPPARRRRRRPLPYATLARGRASRPAAGPPHHRSTACLSAAALRASRLSSPAVTPRLRRDFYSTRPQPRLRTATSTEGSAEATQHDDSSRHPQRLTRNQGSNMPPDPRSARSRRPEPVNARRNNGQSAARLLPS